MIKLLTAGFTRLRKSKIFWLLSIFSIVLALLIIYSQYNQMIKYNRVIDIERLILNYSTLVGVLAAIFISLFLGVEYSDGAIKNKICIGHSRIKVYLSNLFLVTITVILAYVLFFIVMVIVGMPLFGWITVSLSNFVMRIFVVLMIIVSYCAIFTFISMVCSNKTMIAIINIMTAFGLMIGSTYCFSILNTPEYIDTAQVTDSKTNDFEIVKKKNPSYPSEKTRKIYQTIIDVIPSGQAIQVSSNASNIKYFPIYSLTILVVFTSSGLIIFNRKDLK